MRNALLLFTGMRNGIFKPRPHRRSLHRYAFDQVARLIHVTATADCDMVGEQLQRNDLQDRRKQFGYRRDFQRLIHAFPRIAIPLCYNPDYDPAALLGSCPPNP